MALHKVFLLSSPESSPNHNRLVAIICRCRRRFWYERDSLCRSMGR